ncbi:hypothetical protein BH23CHL5_BH23CHL5_06860 [soil metagenome]
MAIPWVILAVLALGQLIRVARGFNGESTEEALYITSGFRAWHGDAVSDQLLTLLPGSVLWPAISAAGYELLGLPGARLLSLTFFLVAFSATVLGTRNLFGQRAAEFTAVSMAVSAPFLAVAHLALMESFALAGMAAAFFALTMLIERDDRTLLLLGSLGLTLAVLGQFRSMIFVIPLGLLLLTMRGRKGRLDLIVLFLSSSLGFIVYFEAFSQQVEIAMESFQFLTPHLSTGDFASASTKRGLLLIWGALPLLIAIYGCWRATGKERRMAISLIVLPVCWLLALLFLAEPSRLLVFPDLAAGSLMAYPVIGLGLSYLSLRGPNLASLGLAFVLVLLVSLVHVGGFDRSWPDYRPLSDRIVAGMDPGDGVLVNEQWPFAVVLYDAGLIETPDDLVDAEMILGNSELLDLCAFEWMVELSEPLAWPAFVGSAATSCGGFELSYATMLKQTYFSNVFTIQERPAPAELWFNSQPFGDSL